MKELISPPNSTGHNNHLSHNYAEVNTNSVPNGGGSSKRYAIFSSEWISAIGEELEVQNLPDTLAKKLAEDASYRLREVLYKCVTRLRHSKKKRLTSSDVNSVITNLCDVDPVMGVSEQIPEYSSEANLFVPYEEEIDLVQKINDPQGFPQRSAPFLQETEIVDRKLLEVRNNYAKRALKMLFNGSQKTFQVLLNDCATNECLGGEGVVDKLMSISRSMVISSNAQYTRVSTRTCQLIIAITSNSKAVYPYHLNSVDKLTELLLELLLGQGFVNRNLETLFKECALKLMLRWPSVANKFVPMLKSVLLQKKQEQNFDLKKREIALELLAGCQPHIFLEEESSSPLSLSKVLNYANQGSEMWYKIALSICAFIKSSMYPLKYDTIIEHFGDSILPYMISEEKCTESTQESKKLPITVRSRIKYAGIRSNMNGRSFVERQRVFSESTLKGPRREIRFAFSGSRSVPSNNLRRVSLKANYQILRNEVRAPYALIASKRLLIFKGRKKQSTGLLSFNRLFL